LVGRGVTDLKSHEMLFRFQFKGKKLALLCFFRAASSSRGQPGSR
jgi:hypothetical protein